MKDLIDRIIHSGLPVAFHYDRKAAEIFVRESIAEIKREMAASRDRAYFPNAAAIDNGLEIIRLKCLLPRFVWDIDYWTDLGATDFNAPTYEVPENGPGVETYHRSKLSAELKVVLDYVARDSLRLSIFMTRWREKIAEWEPEGVSFKVRGTIDPWTNYSSRQAEVNSAMRTIFVDFLIAHKHDKIVREMIFGRP